MIFPSYIFIFIFLPIVLCFWLSSLPARARLFLLTVSSYVFYGWWDYRFVSLLFFTTVIDYYCGKKIGATENISLRKTYLIISMTVNLVVLGFFKYYDFFIGSLSALLNSIGITSNLPILNIILPIGISFYTFQTMSYALDIYLRKAKPVPNFLYFAAFVSIFPHLVAGPIVRYREIAWQLEQIDHKKTSLEQFANGWWFFVVGLAKKLIIADEMAFIANRLFDGSHLVQTGHAWAGSLAYSMQIYFDFSGYSDMAVGLGLMLGFRFPINFNSPYKAQNISDFWNRWHITLSHFLRDYLFIPLGGSRNGLNKTLRNLMITMFLGGLWHGAEWTFVLWGVIHGLMLVIHALFKSKFGKITSTPLLKIISIATTFLCVHFAWVLFRAPSYNRAKEIYRGLFGLNGTENLFALSVESMTFGKLPNFIDIFGGPEHLPYLLLGLIIAFFAKNSHEIKRSFSTWQAVILALVFVYCLGAMGKETPFLYFQF